ncbi:putative glutathione transferase [Helianthus debilis subsp. tardiflorus]
MADELKLYAASGSPFVFRVELAFILKGVTYKTVEENMKNKSSDLLKYNPVYKQVPVLVHNGNPIPESLVIIEYIDDVWKGSVESLILGVFVVWILVLVKAVLVSESLEGFRAN